MDAVIRREAHLIRVSADGAYFYVPMEQPRAALDARRFCTLEMRDARLISREQQRHIYATLRDIALFAGYTVGEMHDLMIGIYAERGGEFISIGGCSMAQAREFIDFLIDFCLTHGVPCSCSLKDRCDDVQRYVYMCLLHKRCCLTGTRAELHHVDAVGAGRNRNEIIHMGHRVLPLCHDAHMEFHTIGRDTFLKKYALAPVRLDERLCRVWGVKFE
jgi:hypothetical protein